jgi:hypothetical protein
MRPLRQPGTVAKVIAASCGAILTWKAGSSVFLIRFDATSVSRTIRILVRPRRTRAQPPATPGTVEAADVDGRAAASAADQVEAGLDSPIITIPGGGIRNPSSG